MATSESPQFFCRLAHRLLTRHPCPAPSSARSEAGADFFEYQARHRGVSANSNTGTSLYYSFDQGLVHYLAFNSETYIAGGIAAMLDFMTQDLASVDRAKTPWVVAFSHKLFWMDSTDFSKINGILQAGGVDIIFAGHWRASWLPPFSFSSAHLTSPPHSFTASPFPCL